MTKTNRGALVSVQFLKERFSVSAASVLFVIMAAVIITAAIMFDRHVLGGDKAELKQETPLSAGDLEKELKSVNADIAQDAENPKLYLHKALLIYQTGPSGYIESIKNFEKARDLGSLDPRIFYYLGTLYQYEGLYDYSAKEYLRFLNNYPKDKEVRMLLGKLYFKNGDDDMAMRQFEIVNAAGEDAVALENIALIEEKRGQDSSSTLKKLRSLGPLSARRAQFVEAKSALAAAHYDDALALLTDINTSLEKNPDPSFDQIELLKLLASAYKGKGDRENARALLRKAQELAGGGDDEIKQSLGDLSARPQKAVSAKKTAVKKTSVKNKPAKNKKAAKASRKKHK